MSDLFHFTGQSPFQISLDREIVALPGNSLGSMLAMLAHFQSLGLPWENIQPEWPGLEPFDSGGDPISFRALGRLVIRAARGHVQVLQARTEEIQSLFLINNWKVADRLWAEFLPECKTPLLELRFLEELWGIVPHLLDAGEWSVVRQAQQLALIQAEVGLILTRRQNLVELSDTVERHMGFWLKRLNQILEKLDEKSLA